MSIFLDVIIFLIVGLTLFYVVKKGFFRSLFELLGVISSLIVAKIFAPGVSNIFFGFFEKSIGEKIEESFRSFFENTEATLNSGDGITALVEKYNLDILKLSEISAA